MNIRQLFHMGLLGSFLLFMSCTEDDGANAPIAINFTNTELGLSSAVDVGVTFSRAVDVAGSVKIIVQAPGLTYGKDHDFYTEPLLTNDELVLEYQAGSESVVFSVHAGSSLNIRKDEHMTLSLDDQSDFVAGNDRSTTITVTENFVTSSGTLIIDGGGKDFPNQSYIDLSKLTQTVVDKHSWDLGFATESGEHHVILNASAHVMARPIKKTNIDEVTSADTIGFGATMYLSNYQDTEASTWIDDQSGDLSQTAIGAISDVADENQVFIIKRDGTGRNWKKVRVTKDGDQFTLEYADLDANTHSALSVTKDDMRNFNYVDLDNGILEVVPAKENWDIMYSSYAGRVNFGTWLAIGYNDYVILNRSGTSAVMVEESTIAYDQFKAEDLGSITLQSKNISVIGSSWRSLVDFNLVLNEEVYYIISDSETNIYKLKFVRLKSESGERGYPEFKIELL